MKVSVEINGASFNELVQKGIDGLDEATVKSIAMESLRQVFSDPETVNRMVYVRDKYYNMVLRPEFDHLVRQSIKDEDLKEFKDQIMDILRKDGHRLIVDAMTNVFINSMFGYEARHEMMSKVYQAIEESRK